MKIVNMDKLLEFAKKNSNMIRFSEMEVFVDFEETMVDEALGILK